MTSLIKPRRARLSALASIVALAAGLFAPVAGAQAPYPAKSVKVVVPFGPGSATDLIARTISEELRAELGESFLVENRAGANGFIAAEMVARAAPDGYTLFVTSSTTQSTNPSLFKKLPYDPVKDFAPIGGIIEGYYVLTVPNELPVQSMADLIAWLKANPTQASYGWGATVSQITGATFLRRIGATAAGVPYKSSPQAVTDLIGGRLTFMFQDVVSALAHIRGGRVKALAVTSPVRNPSLPGVPTIVEAGLPNFEAATYVGMLAPAGTPEAIITRLSNALVLVLKKPAVIQKMDSCCSARMFPTTPAEFDEYLKRDRAAWAQRISAAGIQPE